MGNQNNKKTEEEEFDFSDIVEDNSSKPGEEEEFDFSDIVASENTVKKKDSLENDNSLSLSQPQQQPSLYHPSQEQQTEFRPYKNQPLKIIRKEKIPSPNQINAPKSKTDSIVDEVTPLFNSWANDLSLADVQADGLKNDFFQKLLRSRTVSTEEEAQIKERLDEIYNNSRQIRIVNRKLKDNPQDINSRYSLAYHQNKMGNNKDAISNYQQIIDRDKSFVDAYTGMAYIYGKTGNNIMAVDVLDDGIKNNPTDASLYLNRGTYKNIQKDDAAALKDYATAYKMAELAGDKHLMEEASLRKLKLYRTLQYNQDADRAQQYIEQLDGADGSADRAIDKEYFKEQADTETENYVKIFGENKKEAANKEKHIRENILPKIKKGEPLTDQEQRMWESPSTSEAELKGLERGLVVGEAIDELLKPLDYSSVMRHPIDSAKEYVGKAGETIKEGLVRTGSGIKDILEGQSRAFVDPASAYSQAGYGFLKAAAGILESAGGIIMNFTPDGILFNKGVELAGMMLGGDKVSEIFMTPVNTLFKPTSETGKLGAEVIDNVLQDVLFFSTSRGVKMAESVRNKIKEKKPLTPKDVSTIVEAGSMLDDEAVYDIAEKNGLEVNLNKVEESGGIAEGNNTVSDAELINQKVYGIKESLKNIRPDLKEVIDEVPGERVMADMNERGIPITKAGMAKYFDKVKIGEINTKELSPADQKRFDELSSADPDFMTDKEFKELEELKSKKEPARVESERSVFDEPTNPTIENNITPEVTNTITKGITYKDSDVPVEKRKMLDEVYEKPNVDFANELIDSGLFNSAGQILDWRADIGMSTRDILKGIEDIKAGKNSMLARNIVESAKKIQDKGEIDTIIGRGGNAVRSGIPLDEYFKAIKESPMPEELDVSDIDRSNNIKSTTADIISNEGITKDNFDKFVKENDWLYTPDEINKIKKYLDETTKQETTGNAEGKTVTMESEPVGETKPQDEREAIRKRVESAREELKAAANDWITEQQKLGIIAGKKGAWESAKADVRVLESVFKYAKAQIELGAYTVEKFIKDMYDEFKLTLTNKEAENIFNKVEGFEDKSDNGAASKLGIAKVMESQGAESRKIFLATGWERGTDGKWNYEIPDGDFKNPENILSLMLEADGKEYNLGDLFDADELYEAYPKAKDITIKFINDEKTKNTEAQFINNKRFSDKGTIEINTAKFQDRFSNVEKGDIIKATNNLRGLRRGVLHELEHFVQESENFSKGGNTKMFSKEQVNELGKKYDLLDKGLTEEQIRRELYNRLAGETQARNVMGRSRLSDEQRSQIPFSETEDIGRAEQLLSTNDNAEMLSQSNPEDYTKLLNYTVNSVKEAIKNSDNIELDKSKAIEQVKDTRLYKRLSDEAGFNESSFLADIEENLVGEKLNLENAKKQATEYLDDSQEGRKRKFVETVLGSDKTTEGLKDEVKEIDQFYEGITNKETIAKADREIQKNQTQAEKDVFEATGLDGDVAVKGIRLIKHHESLGNWEDAVKIVDHLTTLGKKAGQGIQAFTLWNKLSPETIVKMSDKMMKEVNKKDLPKDVKETIFKKMSEIGKMPEGTEKTEATMEVLNYIADQIPPTFKEKFDAFRYNNMLSNPLSHARNIYQGLFNTFISRPLDMFAQSAYDYIKHPDNPAAREFQLSDGPGHIKNALTNIPNAWVAAKESYKKGYVADRILDTGGPKSMIEDMRRSKTLRKYAVPTRLMEAEDVFISTMIGQAEKSRLMEKGMGDKEATGKAKELAEKFLYRNRFLTNKEEMDVFARGLEYGVEAINGWRSRKDWVGYGTSWFVPFVMTPMRATQFALEFSPLGFAGGKFSKRKIARATLGSVAMGVGAMMAATDRTTWSAPEDKKERALFYDSGRKPYSVKIGDTWVPMQYFGPFGLAMAIPAAYKHNFKDSKEALSNNAMEALGKSSYGIGKYILETTPLANVGGMFKVLDEESDYTLKNQLGFSTKQLIPYTGFVSWLNKIKDRKYRKPEDFLESIEKDIPFLSDDLDTYKTSEGKDAVRGWESIVLPYATGTNDIDMENKMMRRRENVQKKAGKKQEDAVNN